MNKIFSHIIAGAAAGRVRVIGGAAPINNLFGDAFSMSGNARGSNDILISGIGTDHMWGDAQFINGVAASPLPLPVLWQPALIPSYSRPVTETMTSTISSRQDRCEGLMASITSPT
jgi:hypothetical protein